MDNLKLPAYPSVDTGGDKPELNEGFTKLEMASLMMAQGATANGGVVQEPTDFARYCVRLAKSILEEANK